MTIRDLTTLDECRQVVEIEREVWGEGSELIYASVLSISARRGGILLGAFDEAGAMTGFVWSMPGWREGQPTQWSHMLGVRAAARRAGLGVALKVAQRARALDGPAGLIEWTFDPLQAANAHLNLSVLGAVSGTYWVDAYGALDGPLHRGTPTDRLVAEWWIREPHAIRRLAAHEGRAIVARNADVIDAPAILDTALDGRWTTCSPLRWPGDVRRVHRQPRFRPDPDLCGYHIERSDRVGG